MWIYVYIVIVFFCKQKTAYEMRISDWSSDVCSSDLRRPMDTAVVLVQAQLHVNGYFTVAEHPVLETMRSGQLRTVIDLDILASQAPGLETEGPCCMRSEERRGGKECQIVSRSGCAGS